MKMTSDVGFWKAVSNFWIYFPDLTVIVGDLLEYSQFPNTGKLGWVSINIKNISRSPHLTSYCYLIPV
jgi:hypothetical protein